MDGAAPIVMLGALDLGAAGTGQLGAKNLTGNTAVSGTGAKAPSPSPSAAALLKMSENLLQKSPPSDQPSSRSSTLRNDPVVLCSAEQLFANIKIRTHIGKGSYANVYAGKLYAVYATNGFRR